MTRKDYQMVADVLGAEMAIQASADFPVSEAQLVIRYIAHSLANKFAQSYCNFDRQTFYAACGVN